MKRLLYFIILFFITSVALAQVTVQARIDSSMLLIGEQTNIHFEVTQDKKSKVRFPFLSDSIVKGVDIVSILKPDTIELENGQWKIDAKVTVTSFDSASYYIPSFKFVVGSDTLETNPLSLKVYSVPVDTTKGIYDIKPIYNARINWKEVITIALLILLSLALLTFLFFYIKKRFFTKHTADDRFSPSEPAHVIALRELDRIKNDKLWQQGRLKEYYTDVTTVLRQYMEHRFHLAALEMTSDEILDGIKVLQVDVSVQNSLRQMLLLADLVKFAKWVPTTLEHETTLNNAYLFVNETIQELTEEENEPVVEKENETNLEDHDIS